MLTNDNLLTNAEIKDMVEEARDNGLKAVDFAKLIPCDQSHLSKLQRNGLITHRMSKAVRRAYQQFKQGASVTIASQVDPIQSYELVSTDLAKVVPYNFDGQVIQVIEADEIMMTDRQLGEALGYSQPASAIQHLANAAAESGDDVLVHATIVELTTVDGKKRPVRVWREQGIYILTMISRQPKAAAFRKFAAETLYRVRREQPAQTAAASPVDLAQAMTHAFNAIGYTGQQVAQLQQQFTQLSAKVDQAGMVDADSVVNAVQIKLRSLNTRKARLHVLVDAIRAQAVKLPENDIFSQPFRNYGNVWRAVHAAANPPVSRKDDYTSQAQINTAIDAAEQLLTRLGGAIPAEQLIAEVA